MTTNSYFPCVVELQTDGEFCEAGDGEMFVCLGVHLADSGDMVAILQDRDGAIIRRTLYHKSDRIVRVKCSVRFFQRASGLEEKD